MLKKTLSSLLIISTLVIVNIACSSKNIKPLTELEIAQRLLEEQKINKQTTPQLPVTINISQSGKAIIDKTVDIQLEISTSKPVPFISMIVQPREGLELKPRWLILERKQHSFKLNNIVVDQLYRDTLSVKPVQNGLLGLDIYTVTEIDGVKVARLRTHFFSIGNPLQQKHATEAPAL